MLKKSVIQGRIILAALALFLAGCGGSSRDSKKLLVWHVGSEEEARIINNLADQYFTPTSHIAVQCEAIAWGEAHSKYLTALAGGVAPDVGSMGLTWGTEFGSKGQMVDLRTAFSAELDEIKKQTFPSLWAATEYNNIVYAIPFDMTLQVMYYRNDLIPNPPKTWDELTQLLAKLNKDSKSLIIDWGSLDWIGYAPFLWQAGGSYYNSDYSSSALDKPEAVKALKFFADLYRKYQVPQSGQSIAQGLRSGAYPVGISGTWLINSLPVDAPEIDGKWDLAMLPAGPTGKRTAFIGGRAMGIFSQTKMQQEAWQFLKFISQKDVQKSLYEEVAKSHNIYMPPNVSAWDILPIDANRRKILVAQALDAQAPPPVLGWNDSTRFIVEAIQKVIVNGADAADALKDAAKAMNERVAPPKK